MIGEIGKPTQWDIASREGRSWVYENLLGCNTGAAHRLATNFARPTGRLSRIAAWWLRRELTKETR